MIRDADLLRQYADHASQAAFAEYVRRHGGLVYSTALRIVQDDPCGAADVTQEVFARVARDAAGLATHVASVGWLYVTTRNAARSHMRKEYARKKHEGAAATMVPAPAPADWERVRPLLDDALDRLDAQDREAVLLRYFEGRPFAEIGRHGDISESAARMRVERALDKLQGILASRGVASAAAALSATFAAHASAGMPAGLAASITASVGAVPLATAGGILAFMSNSKSFLVAASMFALLGLGVGGHAWRVAQEARRAEAMAQEREAQLETELRSAKIRLQEAEMRAATSAAPGTANSLIPASGAPAPAAGAATRLFASPDYVEATQKKFLAALPLRYAALYRKLGLSPGQISAFEQALAERNQGTLDIWLEAAKQGLSSDAPSILAMTSAPILASDARLRAILGDGFGDYQEFEKTAAVRALVNSLAGSIYYTDTPLSATQGDALGDAIARYTEQRERLLAQGRGRVFYRKYTETNWDQVQAAMQGTLAPAQLGVLRSLIEQTRSDARMAEISIANPAERRP